MKNGSKEKRIGERPGFTYTGISGEKQTVNHSPEKRQKEEEKKEGEFFC